MKKDFQELFLRGKSLHLLNIFAIAAPKRKLKFQKIYFDFSCCKLSELGGCFTPYN